MDWQHFLPLSYERLGVWLSVLCTFAIYSILYRENPFYRFFEHLFIGLGAGYSLGPTLTDAIHRYWYVPLFKEGYWLWAIVVPFCFYLYFIYSERYGWVSRLVIGVLIGANAGLFFQEFASRHIVQLNRTLSKPLWITNANQEITLPTVINNWIFIIFLLAVLTYFTFSFEHRGPVKRVATYGRWFLMIGLGAMFGNTVMARMALLIGRIYYLLSDWLGISIGGG